MGQFSGRRPVLSATQLCTKSNMLNLLDCTTKLFRRRENLNRISKLCLLLQLRFITKGSCWDLLIVTVNNKIFAIALPLRPRKQAKTLPPIFLVLTSISTRASSARVRRLETSKCKVKNTYSVVLSKTKCTTVIANAPITILRLFSEFKGAQV